MSATTGEGRVTWIASLPGDSRTVEPVCLLVDSAASPRSTTYCWIALGIFADVPPTSAVAVDVTARHVRQPAREAPRRRTRVMPPLGPLASRRVLLGVHESAQLGEPHGRVAPRLVERRLRGCLEFPLESALRGRR